MTNVFSECTGFHVSVAGVAKRPSLTLYESRIGQLAVAFFAPETSRMPVGVHRLDHSADYEFTWNNNIRKFKKLSNKELTFRLILLVSH